MEYCKMPCYNPIRAYMLHDPKTHKNKVFLKIQDLKYPIHMYSAIDLPCGRCIGCRLERSRQWAARLVAESQMHTESSFITLTYANAPESLCKRTCQLFLKRLRKSLDHPIRYYLAGEYGELSGRPHYHACLFGEAFLADRLPLRQTPAGWLYTSEFLALIWGLGYVTVAQLTFESAAYVARYCLKKITGAPAAEHYQGREPEFALMSRRPGIGWTWFQKYSSDCYPSDEFVTRGFPTKPPRYFDKLFSLTNPGDFDIIRALRAQSAKPRDFDLRLATRQKNAELRVKQSRDSKGDAL